MSVFEKVREIWDEIGEGCDSASEVMTNGWFLLQAKTWEMKIILSALLVLSGLIMAMIYALAMIALPFIGPLLLLIAFSYYSHSSTRFWVRFGFMMYWTAIQLLLGVVILCVMKFLWPF